MSQIERLKAKNKEEKDAQLRDWFSSVDTDESGKISVEELRAALMNGDWTPFDAATVKMLMNIYDTDRSGYIEFEEFAGLWRYVEHWQVVFNHFDKDKSGTIDGEELADAMLRLGFHVKSKALSLLQKKYAVVPRNKEGGSAVLTFDHFLQCCVAVKTLSQSFERLDTNHESSVTLDLDTFMCTFLAVA
ncbi:EF-hand [Schizopora paradoxa]|uniref:EF-hand n=1 Tax=Schizopora paradoxa TaxID=27342 RepID=A0A0H2RJR7_9AGAM|nr:EF-hand [Schizopora paradoxa]